MDTSRKNYPITDYLLDYVAEKEYLLQDKDMDQTIINMIVDTGKIGKIINNKSLTNAQFSMNDIGQVLDGVENLLLQIIALVNSYDCLSTHIKDRK